ncbi:MAG: tetratricopeptide repeat protein [Saprospiraceae bacterium]|nr:tetratricopeptide repeat protein [Saprospiraceae bacterium]
MSVKEVLVFLPLSILVYSNHILAFQGSPTLLEEAIQLSQEGYYEQAEASFQIIETERANQDFAFYIARGYNFSWWGKYEEAKVNFNKILQKDAKYVDAIIGLAYTTTWSEDYPAAVHIYNRALQAEPGNRTAYFGLAYNYLAADNIAGARYIVDQIQNLFPTDAEGIYLDGLTAIKELQPEKARQSFKAALGLDPSFASAKEQLGKLVKSAGSWEVEGWYGINENNAGFEQGLRRMHVQYQFNNRDLIYILFDNSLILDNSFLASVERIAPLYAAGFKYGWNDKLFSKIEIGRRDFQEIPDQALINLETNYFFSNRLIGKLILQFDDRQTEQLGLLGISVDLGISDHISIEGTFYHNENFTIDQTFNRRYQLSGKLLVKNFELVLGGYYDTLQNADVAFQQPAGMFAISTFPLYKKLKGKLFFNYDRGFFNNNNTVGALGLNYNF